MTKNQGLVLTLNAGSSSLKFAVFSSWLSGPEPTGILSGQISSIGHNSSFECHVAGTHTTSTPENKKISSHKQALSSILAWLDSQQYPVSAFIGAGHRIVHGGTHFTSPVRIDDHNFPALKKLEALAPHHMPHTLDAIRALFEIAPDLPQIGCFDTAFHAAQPEIETRLSLPKSWHDKGIRRYGFHGLNYEHVVEILPQFSDQPLPHRLIILHLGNGASACAVKNGICASTTMGFSTIDGLIMGSRSGSIDPGVLLHLLKTENISVDALETLLYDRSGLLGLSGISGDMRALLANDQPEARFAINKYCHSAARHIGGLIPCLGGLDALVFTGGIGEKAPRIRAGILDQLSCFGVEYDNKANAHSQSALAAPGAPINIWVIPANEELTIARQSLTLIKAGERPLV